MKLLMLIVDDFEDTECIATLDVLTRGGNEVCMVSLMGRKTITPKLGRSIHVDSLISDIDYKEFDGLIIPGGPGSFKIMPNMKEVETLIRYFADNKKLVASICAAPHLVGKLGYFKNREYTVHPGFEDQIVGGIYRRDLGVVVSDNFITAKSMYFSIDFGLAIQEYFYGRDAKEKLMRSCMGEK